MMKFFLATYISSHPPDLRALKRLANYLASNLYRLFLIACLNLFCLHVIAESYPKKINFRNIMQDQDIALGEVEAIVQDHEGFIWLGGRNALLRYDGYEFLPVSIADDIQHLAQTVPATQVIELFEDSHHDMWAAMRSGLYKYDRAHEVLLRLKTQEGDPKVFRQTINALGESPDSKILVGASSGLSIVDPKSLNVTLIKHVDNDPNSLPSNTINDLLVDNKGNVWLGLDDGLIRVEWSTKKQTLFIPDPANPKSTADNGIKTIAEDHHGNIWFGADNGIYRLNPDTGVIKRYQNDPNNRYSLADNISRQIYVDKKGWVWTGSDQGGISLYDEANDRFLRFQRQDGRAGSLTSNTIRRIYEDNDGDLWVGTYPSGVNYYDRSTSAITVYKKELDSARGLLDNNVEAVEEDRSGNIWIGAGGATRYDPKEETFTHYLPAPNNNSRISSTSVMNGLIDSDGEIRFGSWAHGIQRYNPKSDRFDEVPADTTLVKRGIKQSDKLNDHMVWSIYEDKEKNLWIGTHFNGLTKFDKKTGLYSFYPPDNNNPTAISNPVVWTAFEDSQGRFWVGTSSGLNLMDREQGTFKHYLPKANDPHSLANGSVLSIFEDHKGRLWFGTDAGLHLYHPETDDFTVYTTKDGFIDPCIRGIIEDHLGNLWLGTNNGMVMFNIDAHVVRNYMRYNGEIIGGIATGAVLATRTGEMVFGARSGLYIVDVNKLAINEKIPPVVLTDFRIFTKKVSIDDPEKILTQAINQTDQITLDYTKSMFSFSFSALNFRDSDKNQFAYKLEGFDDKWREVGNQRTALYTNLQAGTYHFHVKASNNDGIWNEEGRSITLHILPPPWKTWWAYSLYTLVFVALLLLFVYMQHKEVLNERKISRYLEATVQERTAELQHKHKELENAYQQLEAISLSDPLTGLSNRRYLQKLIPMDIAKVQREYETKFENRREHSSSLDLTFYLLDVDFFKSVNDTYGHTAGDQLLIQLSELLTNVCRESDCLVRWGGEEFLIVSRFTSRDEAPLMAERIRRSIEEHQFILPDGTLLAKTCSIGFACYPFVCDYPTILSWEQVIDTADHALYAAKKSGRNRSVGLAANAKTPHDMLYQRISSDIKTMIDNNELTVIAGEGPELVWD